MVNSRQEAARGARRILHLCVLLASCAVAAEYSRAEVAIAGDRTPRFAHLTTKAEFRVDRDGRADSPLQHSQNIPAQAGPVRTTDLKFTHLTTDDGLSQGYVVAILQDRRGFMWFATRDGLNRYDGNAFVVYKNNPSDSGSLSSNFIQDLMEDNHGYLWIATNTGVNKFDPSTERCTRYLHDPKNPNSVGGASVKSIAQDSRGAFWFGTEDSGLDQFDPITGRFTHYRNDTDGQFVGRITQVIADGHRDIWFVGERGLFHLNSQTGEIARPAATRNGLSADSVYEDEAGNLWMLVDSPIAGLVKYDRQAERLTRYPFGARAVGVLASTTTGGSTNGTLVADGRNGIWVPSSQGLYYFDRRTERFTYQFQHEDTNPDSLDSNDILSVYRDRGGVLWVGTENAGLNILNFSQEQFGRYMHRPGDPKSLSPGRVKAIYQEPNGVLWAGLFPRALDRLDRKTGEITHYVPNPGDEKSLGEGTNVNGIYKDASGYLWVGGGGSGLDRFDERTGRFKHYRHNPDDPHSLISNNIYTIYGDRNGHIWVGQEGGLSRFDPATGGFINYRPVPDNPASLTNTVWVIDQDRSGALWLGTWGGALIRFDDKTKTFVNYTPDPHDPRRLNGGGINTIHEDQSGTLWVGAMDGLYRYNRQSGAFARYTESQGLPSSTIRCILEDGIGRLWLSTQKGISRFDPRSETFRNYDLSDGLQSNEFSTGCYQGQDGEMFFGGSKGLNAFFPQNVRDNSYMPPVAITSFKIFNKPVPIGAKSVLKKAVPYVDSLTLSYRYSVFSFEFAALSYANSQKNRYRYKLENFESGWNEVGSKQRLATYTNLDPGEYVFRVQGSNSDGVWNEEGASIQILILPPWWRTSSFRVIWAVSLLAAVWFAYSLRLGSIKRRNEELMKLNSELEDSKAKLAEAQQIAHVGHWDYDISRDTLSWSEQTYRIYGVNPGEDKVDLDRVLRSIPPEDRAIAEDGLAQVFEGRTEYAAEHRILRPTGEMRFVQVRGNATRDDAGQVVRIFGTVQDITERKRAEDEIFRLNAELEERVRQRTAQLEVANKELESFSYTVSHDLRAPLRHVSAFSRILMEEHGGELSNESRKLVENIESGTQRMGSLIDGLLKLSRVGRQEICFRAVVLDTVVKNVIEELSPDWTTRQVDWRIGALPTVQGDPDLLQQVFQNLIANALKFSRHRAPAIIEIGEIPQEGPHLLFVRDNGAGFDMKYADKLFGAFQRLHRAEEFEGTGIGLATVRRIVQRHGGKIWAEAKVGEGATFFFTCA